MSKNDIIEKLEAFANERMQEIMELREALQEFNESGGGEEAQQKLRAIARESEKQTKKANKELKSILD